MIQKILSLLVLLAAVATGAWADDDVLNIVVDGTSATIMYDGNANNYPHLTTGAGWRQSGQEWDAETTIRSTITTVTIDGSCNNFSGTNLSSMFANFSGLTTIKGLKNLNTVGVQLMEYMFQGCSSLTSIDLSNFNTASVISMYGMFTGCSSLTTLDLSSFNTEKVTKMNLMFKGCSSLETIYVGDGWNAGDQVNTSTDMFDGCTKLLSMNTANPATDKTNAHTGDGGYLKVKPAGDYLFTVAPCEHGSGTVKFYIDDEEVQGAMQADEGKTVTVKVTPDEGWIVDEANVTAAMLYNNWENAGARRATDGEPGTNVPIQPNIALNFVNKENGVWTFTFTQPASSVRVSPKYLKVSTLYFNPADKTELMEVKVDGKVANPIQDGKITPVLENAPVNLKANRGYVFRKVEVKKTSTSLTITNGGQFSITLNIAGCTTWDEVIAKNPDKIMKDNRGYIFDSTGQYALIKGDGDNEAPVNAGDPFDPNATDYKWGR